jgi:hypothetical protein
MFSVSSQGTMMIPRGAGFMRRFFIFHWFCIQHAWRGCWTKANETASLLGGAVLWLILLGISPQLRERHLIEVPTTYWGHAGFSVALAAASVILAFAVIFLRRLFVASAHLYWAERDKTDTSTSFRLGERIFSETRAVKWKDGSSSDFFETKFYLTVGNGLSDGKTLKRVQTRIFFLGEPVLARVKETGSGEIDIRHGEWAYFELGRIVSKQITGLMSGSVVFSDEHRRDYGHNIPLGHIGFEFCSLSRKRGARLAHNPELPNWSIFTVISADDVTAMRVRLNINMAATNPISYEVSAHTG